MAAVDFNQQPKENKPTPYEKYKHLWGMTQQLNESDPDQLLQKLTLYGQLYEMTGKFSASAKADSRLLKLDRQEQEARSFLSTGGGGKEKSNYTQKERDAKAFLSARLLYKQEIEYENEYDRWENARDSILEQINIMKRKQDIQINLFGRGNSVNGR